MELPTRTLPDNYIAIIKVLPCLYVQSPSLPLRFFSVGKPWLLTALWGNTLQRHCEWWAAKHWTKAGDTTSDRCPWVTFTILKLCSLGKEGACKTCKSGALRQNILPGFFSKKKKNRRLKVDLRLSLVVLFNKFISKGKEEKLFRKRRNTCSRPLDPRGRQGCHSVPCRLARTVHSLATGRGDCLERILCPVRLRSPPHRSEIHKELGWEDLLSAEQGSLMQWGFLVPLCYPAFRHQTEWTSQGQCSGLWAPFYGTHHWMICYANGWFS